MVVVEKALKCDLKLTLCVVYCEQYVGADQLILDLMEGAVEMRYCCELKTHI